MVFGNSAREQELSGGRGSDGGEKRYMGPCWRAQIAISRLLYLEIRCE